MNEIDLSKPLFQLTASEFLALVRQALAPGKDEEAQPGESEANKHLVYGIAGIAQLFNCSKTTANRIKASGKIDAAITQSGRMITVDADLALQLLNKNNSI